LVASVDPAAADARVVMSPSLDDVDGTRWLVDLEASVEVEMLTVGFIEPDEVGSSIAFEGCATGIYESSPPPGCAASGVEAIGPSVDLNLSQARVALVPSGTIRDDTLYVTLVGALDAESAVGTTLVLPASDPDGQARATLGVVEVTGGIPGRAPSLTLDGAAEIQGETTVFVQPGGCPPSGCDDLLLSSSAATSEDADSDGWQDDTDNCQYKWNPDQADQGGEGGLGDQDLIGDLCQCGDTTPGDATDPGGDGVVDPTDTSELLEILTGQAKAEATSEPSIYTEQERRCSIIDTAGVSATESDCDALDAVALDLIAGGASGGGVPSLGAVCVNATSAALASDP
jgi:hypothetical protein